MRGASVFHHVKHCNPFERVVLCEIALKQRGRRKLLLDIGDIEHGKKIKAEKLKLVTRQIWKFHDPR
jgi:hypothetical protein